MSTEYCAHVYTYMKTCQSYLFNDLRIEHYRVPELANYSFDCFNIAHYGVIPLLIKNFIPVAASVYLYAGHLVLHLA